MTIRITNSGSAQSAQGFQNIPYASTLTLNPALGATVKVGALTGPTTVNAPLNPVPGQVLTLLFTQDATGGRIVTFNPIFRNVFPVDTQASALSVLSFIFDGTSWV